MPKHKTTEELQRLSQSLAKKVRQQPTTTDEMYQLLTVFHARLKLLEESSLCTCYKPFSSGHQADCPLFRMTNANS